MFGSRQLVWMTRITPRQELTIPIYVITNFQVLVVVTRSSPMLNCLFIVSKWVPTYIIGLVGIRLVIIFVIIRVGGIIFLPISSSFIIRLEGIIYITIPI